MSRATVRAAIKTYFATPNLVPLVANVYAARPKVIEGTDYGFTAGGGSGAVLVVHLPSDDETRVALGGAHDGRKTDIHNVALEVLFTSVKTDAIAAQEDQDSVLDGVIAAIRADRTLGTGGTPIWQAGEGHTGIKTTQARPVEDGQVLKINAVVRFEAWEWVSA